MTSSLGTLTDVNQDGLPQVPPTNLPQLQHHAKARRIEIISMFDGVGSVYHIVKKELGGPPTVYTAAENDPFGDLCVPSMVSKKSNRGATQLMEPSLSMFGMSGSLSKMILLLSGKLKLCILVSSGFLVSCCILVSSGFLLQVLPAKI